MFNQSYLQLNKYLQDTLDWNVLKLKYKFKMGIFLFFKNKLCEKAS